MLNNKRFVPGILPNSEEYAYSATRLAKKIFIYVEYVGHQYITSHYVTLRGSYCHYQLIYLISGRFVYQTNGQIGEVRPGQALLIETQKPHIYGSIGDSETMWIHFNGAHFQPIFDYIIASNHNSHTFDLRNNPDFTTKLTDLFHSYATSNLYPEIIVSAKMTELVGLLLYNQGTSSADMINSAIRYIEGHYAEPLSLEQMARQAGLSVSRFSTLFKQETGYSPHKYLLNTRLHASLPLLISTLTPVNEVALHIGFADASSYIAAFRKKYNCTPLQYRIQNGLHS